jgi:hypothetical protein
MKTITTTIKREFLAAIVAGTKTSEFREAKPYWRTRLENIQTPFQLRMINGMSKAAPEVTVLVDRVYEFCNNEYELRIAQVLDVKNWS